MANSQNTKNQTNKKSKQKEFRFEFDIKNIFFIVLVVMLFGALFSSIPGDSNSLFGSPKEKSISQIVRDIKDKKVKKIEISGDTVKAYYKNDDKEFQTTTKESGESLINTLKASGVDPNTVEITVKNNSTLTNVMYLAANIIPSLFFVGLIYFIFRGAKNQQEGIFSFGSNRAKRFNKSLTKVTFKDVAGVDEAQAELEEVVDFLKNSQKYKSVGARTPKGVLLVGPAGCGKTLMAKAVAGEANVPFFSIAGSEFMEMLVGIGAARARDLFLNAKKSAPSIIFIDEIDAIGRARSQGSMPGHDEREQTLNQILVEMDGFTPNDNVIVIAATNRGDLLDPALLRPGRFDRRIVVSYPDVEGRKKILAIHAKGKPFEESVNWDKVAHRTVGFSGADLENMLNEAAILAARETKHIISMHNIEEAATKVKLGPEKKRLQSELDRKLTAYHEAGHAIVSHFQSHTDPVHRISIVSRGQALGYTLIPPAKDKLHETKTHLRERLAVMMGGRAAEELVFNEVTTGASNDFSQATSIARAMVTEFGMSSVGPIHIGALTDVTNWGSYSPAEPISQELLRQTDDEVKRILTESLDLAKKIITEKREYLNQVAEALLVKENMDTDEFEAIVGKKTEVGNFA